jgi:hypothetical protein
VTYQKWYSTVKTISFVDTFLTIVLPFFLISTINISISFKLMQFTNCVYRRMKASSDKSSSSASRSDGLRINGRRNSSNVGMNRMTGGYNTAKSSISEVATICPPNSDSLPQNECNVLFFGEQPAQLRRSKSYSRTTRVLVLISVTYMVLNSLMAYSKLRHLFYPILDSATLDNSDSIDLNGELIDRIACYLYYLNFSINFFLYVLNKSKFRDILFELFKKK